MEIKQFEDLKKTLHDVVDLQAKRSEAEAKFEKTVSDKIDAQNKAADDLIQKMVAIQKKNDEQETIIKQLEHAVAISKENSSDSKIAEYKMAHEIIKSWSDGKSVDNIKYGKTEYETHQEAFRAWFKGGNHSLFHAGKDWDQAQLKFINTVIGPQGGFLVAPEYATTVLGKAFNGRAVFELVDRVNVGSSQYIETVDAADWADATEYNELSSSSEKPSDQNNEDFKRLTYNVDHIAYVKRISRTALEDGFVDIAYHMQKMQNGLERTIAQRILTGGSQDKIRGILTYPNGTSATGTVEQITSSVNTGVTWDDLVQLMPQATKTDYIAKSNYLLNHKSWRRLLVSKDDNARYQMSEILAMLQLISAPKPMDDNIKVNIRLDAGMPDDTTAGNKCVLFGDFTAGYLLVDRIGASIIRDDTDVEDIIFKLRRRIGGQLRLGEALKVLVRKS